MSGPGKEGESIPQSAPEIVAVENFSKVKRLLRGVPLRSDPDIHPYLPSTITLEDVQTSKLVPLALYVLKPNLERLRKLREGFLEQGIDILNLTEDQAHITFDWGRDKGLVITPPLVEISEDDGNLWVVTDGLHRAALTKDLGKSFLTSIVIRNTAAPLPFIPVGWDEVKRVDKVPPQSKKRIPRFDFLFDPKEWYKTSKRNYERYLSGLSDPFKKLGMLHIHVPSKEKERFSTKASSSVLIQDEEGRLLLVQQASQEKGFKWGPPAGKTKAFEDPITAAIRETKEETGFEVELVDIVRIYPISRGAKTTSYGYVFRGKIKSGEIKFATDEIKDCRYFSLEEIDELIRRKKLYRPEYNITAIEDWKNGKSYPLDVIKFINPEEIFENPQNKDNDGQSGVFQ